MSYDICMEPQEMDQALVKMFGQAQADKWLSEMIERGGTNALDAFYRGDLTLLAEVMGDHKESLPKLRR